MKTIGIELNGVYWFHLVGSRGHGYEHAGSTKCNYPWQGEKTSALQERLCSVALIGFRYLKSGPFARHVWVNNFINYLLKSRTLWLNTFSIVQLYYTGCLYSFTYTFRFCPRFDSNVHPVCRWRHHAKLFCVVTLRTSFLRRTATLIYYPYTLKNIDIVFKIDTTRLREASVMRPTVRLLHLTTGST